ncbi:MAG: type II toxin-antitoxin system PemK/MazF family toxin [Bacteroidia bacterium]|nr:type II toxin-antitoxin system PemK/MazF family toxin [Bacteroidia bacterium]
MEIVQYQIALVNLDPTVGSEIRKTRPCVILSPDEMNRHLTTVVVAPITSTSKPYPTRFRVNHENMSGWIAVDQIRTIDKTRIIGTNGFLNPSEIKTLKSIIRQTFVD